MTAFRAAYIASSPDSTSGGILLTDEADKNLSDDELMAKAVAANAEFGAVGEIVIGDWTE